MVSGIRFARRLGFFVLSLAVADGLLRSANSAQGQAFSRAYRLPNEAEVAMLPAFVRHIEASRAKKVIFIGSSPTYGVNIKDPAKTYPFAFQQAARKAGAKAFEVYNVSAKGLLLSDQSFIARRLADDADLMVIQLNYHTFSPAFLKETRMRHPELPDKLEVPVASDEALWTGLRPTPLVPVNPWVREQLRRFWFVYRERDALAVNWWGAPPEMRLFQLIQGQQGEAEEAPFLELSPARQLVIMQRYTKNARYVLTPDNSELRFLKKTVRLLADKGKRVVVFMTPLNVEALDYYEGLDWREYDANVGLMAETVRQAGGAWIDVNRQAPLAAEHFYDISHSLDSGGLLMGEALYRASAELVDRAL